jgi:hypothetical protein
MAMDINTAMDMGTNMGMDMVWNEKIAGDHFYNVI